MISFQVTLKMTILTYYSVLCVTLTLQMHDIGFLQQILEDFCIHKYVFHALMQDKWEGNI